MRTVIIVVAILMVSRLFAQDTPQPPTKRDIPNVTELHAEFTTLDKNRDGFLDAQEFRSSIAGITEDDITNIFDRFDSDRDGVLTFEEYMILVSYSSES